MSLPRILTPHVVVVERLRGHNTEGPVYDEAETIERCRVEDTQKLVRTPEGTQVVATSMVVIRPEYGAIPVGSRVTLWSGQSNQRVSVVVSCSYYHTPPAPTHYVLGVA